MDIQDIIRNSGNLPASEIVNSVNATLTEKSTLIITAPPGAGKSTLLPLTIQQGQAERNTMGKVIMLEPRRLAARQIAERMASILNEPVGKTVGYRIRFENKVSKDTSIEVLTEGILTRMLIDDPTLDGIETIIFDEFHERSLNSDLALALTRQTQQLLRPDLKIIIMSATIDTASLCQSLHAPLIESKGRMFPVKVYHAEETPNTPNEIAEATVKTILKAYREHEGDILAFLPGQGEIMRCADLLNQVEFSHNFPSSEKDNGNATTTTTRVFPLYGNLPQDLQRKAIAPSRDGERKIVLATPIAETSLTIEGVRIVVDSGLYRRLIFDTRSGLSHLETTLISLDMATQRTGRAGRITDGVCYRLWTLATEHQMEEQRKPEILEADFAPLVLAIYTFGESDIESLPWVTPPPSGNIAKARNLLEMLGAFSPLGKKMAALPCHPRIAKMILSAENSQQKSLACDIAALLEEKDPLAESNDCDLSLRLSTLRDKRRKNDLGKWSRIAKIANEYLQIIHTKESNTEPSPEDVGFLVANAFPERIAMSMDNIGNYRLASGNWVKLDESDMMTGHKWLVIASMYTNSTSSNKPGRVFLAAPIANIDLQKIAKEQEHLAWDSTQGRVVIQIEKRIGKLVIDSKPIHDADKNSIIDIICETAKKEGLSMFDWNEKVQQLQLRVAQVATWHPELAIPNLSTEHLLQNAKDWLPFYLEENGHIKTSIAELKKLNLQEILWNSIPYELQIEIDRLAPTHVRVPSGSHIRVDYRKGAEAPVLSVRLQECFGMETTPCVNDGKQPLLMELLSPGFKPVQLTQDLKSFWEGTYFDVRKELKRRYPKHYWPENPLESEAVRGVKRKP